MFTLALTRTACLSLCVCSPRKKTRAASVCECARVSVSVCARVVWVCVCAHRKTNKGGTGVEKASAQRTLHNHLCVYVSVRGEEVRAGVREGSLSSSCSTFNTYLCAYVCVSKRGGVYASMRQGHTLGDPPPPAPHSMDRRPGAAQCACMYGCIQYVCMNGCGCIVCMYGWMWIGDLALHSVPRKTHEAQGAVEAVLFILW